MLYDLKLIEGTDCYYVSRCGSIYSKARGKLIKMKPVKDRDEYFIVTLSYSQFNNTKIRKNKKVHRLVADAFIPNPNNYPIIDHKNNNKQDNRVENLQWCTVKFNTQKAYNDGVAKAYERTEEQIRKLNEACRKSVKVIFNDNIELIFNSRNECAEYLKMRGSDLSSCIKGKRKIPKRCNIKSIEYL